MDRRSINVLAASVALLTLVWAGMVVYVGVRIASVFHVGFTSCLPGDFPSYPEASISSVAISLRDFCSVQFETRDSGQRVAEFFETNLDEGDWVVRAVGDQAGHYIIFSRHSNPSLRGIVQILVITGQTQFQIQIRGG